MNRGFVENESEFIKRLGDTPILQFLRNRPSQAHVVGSKMLLNFLTQKIDPQFSYAYPDSPLDNTTEITKNIFVFQEKDEALLMQRIAAEAPHLNIWSIRHHVLPWLSAESGHLTKQTGDWSELKKYVIFSTPRSGSTYLCRLLSANGLGRPKEHIRPLFAYLFRHYSFKPLNYLATLAVNGQNNSVFGTKLISEFMFDMFSTEAKLRLLRHWLIRGNIKPLYLVRQDKIGQTISQYFAKATQFWHLYDNQLPSYDAINYNFEEILKHYLFLQDQEEKLSQFISSLPNVSELLYEDICLDPETSVDNIALSIATSVTDITQEVQIKQISKANNKMSEFRERFTQELKVKNLYDN